MNLNRKFFASANDVARYLPPPVNRENIGKQTCPNEPFSPAICLYKKVYPHPAARKSSRKITDNELNRNKKNVFTMTDLTNPSKSDNELILRDYLALERTRLANERTLFSYLRTSLYLLTAGIGIFQIESISRLDWLAWVCVIAGIVLFFLGIIRFRQMRTHLKTCLSRPADCEHSAK